MSRRRTAICGAVLVTLALLTASTAGAQGGDREVQVERLPADATAVSIRLAHLAFPEEAETVLIARNDGFADALASGPLQAEAPLLLVDGRQPIPDAVRDELDRLEATTAVVLGGEAAVSAATADSLRAAGLEVQRLAAATRTGTAALIAQAAVAQAGAAPDQALLTRAFGDGGDETRAFADALVAGAVAAELEIPLLLTATSSLSVETAEVLPTLDVDTVTLVGGQAAIAADVAEEVAARGVGTDRVSGASRTETALALHRLRPSAGEDATTALVIDGNAADAWTAGFAGAALAGRTGAPVVLSAGSRLEQGALDVLAQVEPDHILCHAPQAACDAAVVAAGGVVEAPGQVGDLRVTPWQLPAPHDFATEVHGDPWDYANPEDIILEPGPVQQVTAAGLADGVARWSSQGGYVHLHWPGFPGSIDNQRDGERIPIDGDRYRTFTMRVNPSQAVGMALAWQSCPGAPGACNTFGPMMNLQPGWQTVAVPLEWSGPIYGVRLSTTSSADIELDDVRLLGPTEVVGQITGATGVISVEPLDEGLRQAASRGLPRAIGGGTLDPATLPPGTYRLTDEAGSSTTVRIVEPPRLRILAPHMAGGEDYAEATTGDAWDFDQPTDVVEVGNARDVVWADGMVRATNTTKDPYLQMRMGPVPLDPNRYHRVTVTFGNDGPLDLSFEAGGGSHGRVIFRAPEEGPHQSEDGGDIVAYPQYRTYTFSMRAEDAVEGGTWTGAPVGHLRFDPNEDPAARGWFVSELRIRADHESSGAFTVGLADVTPPELRVGPTTVEVGIDQDPTGFDGVVLARGLRTEGALDVPVSTCGLAPGSYHVWVRATNGVASSSTYASGPLQVTNTAC